MTRRLVLAAASAPLAACGSRYAITEAAAERADAAKGVADVRLPRPLPPDPTLPVAAVRNVPETFFGSSVDDPYRYFEEPQNPEVAAWMKAQDGRARRLLASLPGRATMLAAIARYDDAVPQQVMQVTRAPGGLYFYERRARGEQQFKLYVKRGLDGSETLLVDPEQPGRAGGKAQAINYYSVSPDGRRVAYGISAQGSEAATLRVLDVASGKPVGEPITRADFGSVGWSPDSRHLFFNRLQAQRAGAAPAQRYQGSQVWRLRLGDPLARAQVVFGASLRGVGIGAAELPFVGLTHDGRWAFGVAQNGTQREIGLFLAPQKSLLGGRPAWRRLFDARARITSFAYFGNTLYLCSEQGAPRGQLFALDLAQPQLREAKLLLAQSDQVLTGVAAAADALYVERRDGNLKRLSKLGYKRGATLQEVKLPFEGSFELAGEDGLSEGSPGAADPRLPGLLLDLQGWNRARQLLLVQADGSVRNSGLQPAGAYDSPPGMVVRDVKVSSFDGAQVPLSIIHREGLALDGSNPTILSGYAGYGVSEEPFYSASRLAWLEAGGVYAVANPRGSGVYGEDWYRAGVQASKPNSWKDFIACAEFLIAQKYCSPARLGLIGGSAGGILAGRAMTERPELFAAVILAAGALDMVRAELTPNGATNIPEFGSRKTAAGFRALLAMSTYHQIRDGVAYPGVLLTHGVNDPRVEVWHSSKTAARLQAATSSGRPVVLRLDEDAGHGIGDTRQQVRDEHADMYSFLLWQMGVPAYQPPEPSR